jgi:hypothetical protein
MVQMRRTRQGIGPHHDWVQIIGCNDSFTADGAEACAQEAVAVHVIAVLGFTYFVQDVLPIYDAAKIPYLGGLYYTSENKYANAFLTTLGAFIYWADFYLAAKECTRTAVSF